MKKHFYFKIIIPNFNNEKYLAQCLESIFSQTFTDFCVIFVDDASTDSSFSIAEDFQKQNLDRCICIKSDKKIYQGICRNIGINYEIDSDYTWFIDSDDYLPTNTVLQELYEATQNSDQDMIYFNLIEDKNGILTEKNTDNIEAQLKSGTYFRTGYLAPWARVYKTETLVGMQYESCLFEDMIFIINYLDKFSKLKHIDKALYCYRINDNGDTKKKQQHDPIFVERYSKTIKRLAEVKRDIKKTDLRTAVNIRLYDELNSRVLSIENAELDVMCYFVGENYNNIKLLQRWYQNMKYNYCYDLFRKFVIYTDNIEAKSYFSCFPDVLVVLIDPVENKNIRLLMKFHLIHDYFQKYRVSPIFSFIQSNCVCNRKILSTELYHKDKITLNQHSCQIPQNLSFNWLYGDNSNTSVNISEKLNRPYYQAGHFICDVNFAKQIAQWIVERINLDLSRGICTKWHDETYFNYYFAKIFTDSKKIVTIDGNNYLDIRTRTGSIVATDKKILFASL